MSQRRGHFRIATHPGRLKKVKYRAPYSREWQDIDLEKAMDMIAERVWDTRERTFQEMREGESLMQTTAMAHPGGATLDNEENYLIKKLFTAGLGMGCVSNQARITRIAWIRAGHESVRNWQLHWRSKKPEQLQQSIAACHTKPLRQPSSLGPLRLCAALPKDQSQWPVCGSSPCRLFLAFHS